MNTLLKQLTIVLEEEGILIENLEVRENKQYNMVTIIVNNNIRLVHDRDEKLFTLYLSSDAWAFKSLTGALECLVNLLRVNEVREGDILVSGNGYYTYKVIKHRMHDKYNLLNVETNQLEYMESVEPGLIHKQISAGVYVKESTENKEGSSLPELVVLLSELVYDDLTKEERDDKKLKVFEKAMDAKKELENKGEM